MSNTVTCSDGTLSMRAWRRVALIAALALAAALSMTIAASAQAESITLYEHDNFGGRQVTYAVGSADMTRFGPFFNDMASSYRNNSGSWWCAYEHANYGGSVLRISPWSSNTSLGGWNDRISSIRKC
jgi:ABC-type transport system substrate-binding protein